MGQATFPLTTLVVQNGFSHGLTINNFVQFLEAWPGAFFSVERWWQEYYVKEENPYTGEMSAKEIKAVGNSIINHY